MSTTEQTRIELLHSMPKQSVCAEIGVYKGDFSSRIIDIVNPTKLYLIDPWQFHEEAEYKNSLYGGILEKIKRT